MRRARYRPPMAPMLVRGSLRGAVALLLGALLLLPSAALAAKPKPGHYSGTTEQGEPIAFDVQKPRQDPFDPYIEGTKRTKKRRVLNLEWAVDAPCESGSTVQAGGILPGSEKVSRKGKFSYAVSLAFTVEAKGKFTTKTKAKGTLRYTIFTASNGYCDSGSVSWQARRG